MTILEMDSEVCNLRAEEERILASFTQRLIEIAAVSGAHETASSPIAALNAMRLTSTDLSPTRMPRPTPFSTRTSLAYPVNAYTHYI
jgi:hypothetical protein